MLTKQANKTLSLYFYPVNPRNYEKEAQHYHGVIYIIPYRAHHVAGLLGYKRL